jgi:hypothetical protein
MRFFGPTVVLPNEPTWPLKDDLKAITNVDLGSPRYLYFK